MNVVVCPWEQVSGKVRLSDDGGGGFYDISSQHRAPHHQKLSYDTLAPPPPPLTFLSCLLRSFALTLTTLSQVSYRVQQLDVRVETKTKDNVFITAVVSVQYQVLKEKVYDAFYSLTNPAQQVSQ